VRKSCRFAFVKMPLLFMLERTDERLPIQRIAFPENDIFAVMAPAKKFIVFVEIAPARSSFHETT
jgi:hypothetical protein